jgi:hypothetical protein
MALQPTRNGVRLSFTLKRCNKGRQRAQWVDGCDRGPTLLWR